jgi:hypothetical protein
MLDRVYYRDLPVAELTPGVNRPQNWWDKHPKSQKMLERIKTSILEEGVRNPLVVYQDSGNYIVAVGNQRLQALRDLGIKTAPCIVSGIAGEGSITSKAELESYFKDGINQRSLRNVRTIKPNDTDLWDGDKQFRGQNG